VSRDGQALDRLQPLLAHAAPASLLLVPADAQPLEAQTVLPLVHAAQEAGTAVLIADDAQLARTIKADGVHLDWGDDIAQRYEEAREILGRRAIVGVDAGRSRHHAMSLGEAGADYIGFGIPAHVEDREKARLRRQELVAWWAEIFEPPVVAFDVEDHETAKELAAAGADFVARRVPSGLSPGDMRAWLDEAGAAIARVPATG
jgi:thiamine-phosphate pyrophosphorylase